MSATILEFRPRSQARAFTEQDVRDAYARGYMEGAGDTITKFAATQLPCSCPATQPGGWAS